jgi:UDP-glucose 4-epimerase
MRILLTGGAGFIGSAIANQLLAKGYEVGVYDKRLQFINNPHYYKAALKFRKKHYKNKYAFDFKGDIRDVESLKKAFKEFKPEVVVHLAGLPMARPIPKHVEDMHPINMQGTLNVLDVFEKSKSARKLIYTSSSMSYGHFTQSPQPEDVMLFPINAYGACKAAGEYFVKLSHKEWVIVRPTSVYGFTDCANRVSQLLIDAALTKRPAWIVRGENLDFSYVEDVADGFVRTIEQSSADYQTFNISRGEPRSAVDYAEIVKKHFPDFEYEVREPTVQQVFRGALDISRARKFLGFKPQYSIEEGIERTLNLMKEYNWADYAYKE